jgi:hypothetical protein
VWRPSYQQQTWPASVTKRILVLQHVEPVRQQAATAPSELKYRRAGACKGHLLDAISTQVKGNSRFVTTPNW